MARSKETLEAMQREIHNLAKLGAHLVEQAHNLKNALNAILAPKGFDLTDLDDEAALSVNYGICQAVTVLTMEGQAGWLGEKAHELIKAHEKATRTPDKIPSTLKPIAPDYRERLRAYTLQADFAELERMLAGALLQQPAGWFMDEYSSINPEYYAKPSSVEPQEPKRRKPHTHLLPGNPKGPKK